MEDALFLYCVALSVCCHPWFVWSRWTSGQTSMNH